MWKVVQTNVPPESLRSRAYELEAHEGWKVVQTDPGI